MEAVLNKPDIQYPWMNRADFLAEKEQRGNVLLIDIRTPSEFGEAHIPESTNIPLADLHHFLPELKAAAREKKIVLVCRTQNRVKVAYEQILKAGISHCQILEGGIHAWREAGHTVIQGRASISLERQVRMVVGVLIMVGVALGIWGSPWFLLLPALVGAGLIHAGLTDSCFMAMLLARLPFNRMSSGSLKL